MQFRIFISSVQKEFSQERKLLAEYIRKDAILGKFFSVFVFEEVPAQERSATDVYLSEVDACDIYLGILGMSYGHVDKKGVSATEREYERAERKGKERICFVRDVDGREPKEAAFVMSHLSRRIGEHDGETGAAPTKYELPRMGCRTAALGGRRGGFRRCHPSPADSNEAETDRIGNYGKGYGKDYGKGYGKGDRAEAHRKSHSRRSVCHNGRAGGDVRLDAGRRLLSHQGPSWGNELTQGRRSKDGPLGFS